MRLRRVSVPGQVRGVVVGDPTGPIFLTGYDRDAQTAVLTAVDPAGGTVWRHEYQGRPGSPRALSGGTVWIAHSGPDGHRFTELSADGEVLHAVDAEHEPHEHFGAFVVLPDGFLVTWLPADPGRRTSAERPPRAARHDRGGGTVWSTPLPVERLSFPGVVEAGVHTGWETRPMRPWKPTMIAAGRPEPLLVSGDRALVGITDQSSGIGICAVLDTADGRVVTVTPPGPYGYKAIAGAGAFLVGMQGYGAFTATLYGRDGHPVQTWPSHAQWLVDRHGTISGPESENVLPSNSAFRILEPDGSLRGGPPLGGYYTTHPALDADGTAVFWRDGRIRAIGPDLVERTLLDLPANDVVAMSRIVLLPQGLVAFRMDRELLLLHDTGLAELDSGPWPCGAGNLQGNPVAGPPS
ncbi:hypothetical protein Val02_30580 [Virgisporangium aliadipatigenens]|uniref:Uncharacterized protein n=1 Tax=Virgisporangium aliadipatigenens TaxID=741659 RepID=A0A8J3YKN1_9ACTN|nr:hypothetical protein [Virgisporangium aliadipatigenens]GIJ46172.1 hypothetical protein Val02_30580 [Virgisporangium aliadipatigenens]